jgi:hypothetical protein
MSCILALGLRINCVAGLYIVATFFIAAALVIDLSVADSYLGVNVLGPVLIFVVSAAQAVHEAAWITKAQQEEVVQFNVFGDPVVVLKNAKWKTSIDLDAFI